MAQVAQGLGRGPFEPGGLVGHDVRVAQPRQQLHLTDHLARRVPLAQHDGDHLRSQKHGFDERICCAARHEGRCQDDAL